MSENVPIFKELGVPQWPDIVVGMIHCGGDIVVCIRKEIRVGIKQFEDSNLYYQADHRD